MSGGVQMQRSAVDRAAELFTSLAAIGPRVRVAELSRVAQDHALADGELVDALAFLEANGLIEVETVVVVRGRRA